jgi:hypothetical protein
LRVGRALIHQPHHTQNEADGAKRYGGIADEGYDENQYRTEAERE